MSKLLPAHGGYCKLFSFKVAQFVYDATVAFFECFIDKRSRIYDQMVQADRSAASMNSSKFEFKLTGVVHASLQERLLDYEDFSRQRSLLCNSDGLRSIRIRQAKISSLDELRQLLATLFDWQLPSQPANAALLRQERAANAINCLIRQAIF